MKWTIIHIDGEGKIESGPIYTKKATAELGAAWRGKKRNEKWEAVELPEEGEL